MDQNIAHNFRVDEFEDARRLLEALHARFVGTFQREMVKIVSYLGECSPERAKVYYFAGPTTHDRLEFVRELVRLEIPEQPITRPLMNCIDQLDAISTWADVELDEEALARTSLLDFVVRLNRCRAIFGELRSICGEPIYCRSGNSPVAQQSRDLTGLAFEPAARTLH